MRPEEEFCRRCFDGYLNGRVGLQAAWWPGPDPPDYFMATEGSIFAVEVTRLIGQVGGPGGPSMGDAEYEASMQRLCAEIEEAAFDHGILRGLYMLNPVGPFRKWARASRLIKSRVLEHIRTTQAAMTSPRQVIFSETAEQMKGLRISVAAMGDAVGSFWVSGSCSIAKLGDSRDGIYCVATAPGRAMFEGEALAKACRMLQRALIRKKRELRNTADPKILLLLHEWPMVNGSTYRSCVDRLRFLECYHSVFVVETADEGYLLHSEEPGWVRARD
jgi:hypothetical protein